MRNTREYPITVHEVDQAMLDARTAISSEHMVGDPRPLALSLARQFLFDHSKELEKFLKTWCKE